MKRSDRPAERPASTSSVDPLDEALRQIGADMLEEPVPERLKRVLRRLAEQVDPDEDRASGNRDRTADDR